MRTLVVYLFAAVVVGAGLFLGFPHWFLPASSVEGGAKNSGQAPPVLITAVQEAPFLDRLEALGTVRAREAVDVTSTRADRVRAVHFDDGDVVEAGAVLVELHDEEEKAQLAEAEADLERRLAQFTRVDELTSAKISSRGDLDAARAELDGARARVVRLNATIDEHRITAPFGGLLGFRRVSKGAYVQPSSVITTLDDLSSVWLDITIPETWLDVVRADQEVHAATDAYGDRSFVGRVRTVGSRLDASTRSAMVRAEIDNPELLLRPGMLMKVEIRRDDAPTMQVPEQALLQRGREHFVMRVVGDGEGQEMLAEEVRVEVGRRRPGFAEIVSGLAVGDDVVVAGISQVRAGAPVRVAGRREQDA